VNILLNNTCTFSIGCWIYNYCFNFFEFFCYLYTLTSVCVLSWLYNPYILCWCWRLVVLGLFCSLILFILNLFFYLNFLFGALLRWYLFIFIFSFFLFESFFSFMLSLVLNIIFKLIVVISKFIEFRIFKASFDMKGEWKIIKYILANCLIIVFHVYI
jgi:hypothetical protein